MKVVHVIPTIERTGGGPCRSSQALVAALEAAGCEAWLLITNVGEKPWVDGVTHFAVREPGEGLAAFFRRQFETLQPDLVHIHGIWNMPFHIAAKIARQMKIPYVIAPRGTLEPWSLAQKMWKKRLAMFLYQRKDLREASALHATAASEGEEFRRLGFTQPVITSPNGVIVPKDMPPRTLHADGKHRAIFVSRMHPKKNVLGLVEAWAKIRPEGWVCELVYTKRGETETAYEAQVKERVAALGLEDQFIFTGPLMDNAKWTAYRRADLFVLPTFSENFGIAIPEALHAELPVITTKGTPWGELETERCGWWIDIGVEPLAAALREAMALSDDDRAAMGARGRSLVAAKYQWPAIGRQMLAAYESILESD